MTERPKGVNSIVMGPDMPHTWVMRLRLIFAAVVLTLSGCLPLSTYYKTGVPVARLQSDTTACEIRALRDVPVATQIRTTPPRYVPPRKFCKPDGSCITKGGYWIEGEVYSYDANKSLRARANAQCMAAKGYRPVEIPPCPDRIARSVQPAATKTLPALTPNSCVIRNKGGSWQIVTSTP